MKFKIDENLPDEAAATLREQGFEARTVREESLSGAADNAIAVRVPAENRILVTLDLDFSNIGVYPPGEYAGIIVLRPRRQDKPTVLSFLRRVIMALDKRTPTGQLWIVQGDRIRFHQGSQSLD